MYRYIVLRLVYTMFNRHIKCTMFLSLLTALAVNDVSCMGVYACIGNATLKTSGFLPTYDIVGGPTISYLSDVAYDIARPTMSYIYDIVGTTCTLPTMS